MVRLSVLDLSPITEGRTAADALRNSLELAQRAEEFGFYRYWVGEHHGQPTFACSSPAIIIGSIAARTSSIRVGAGGVMLPNHAPVIVAEQFGTLESLYPARIDLGLGRSLQIRPADLRRAPEVVDTFLQDVTELLGYFRVPARGTAPRAIPGCGLQVPVWILGSSVSSARLAGALGLPFTFGFHLNTGEVDEPLECYRSCFRPSGLLTQPYVMVSVVAVAANSDVEARRLFTSLEQSYLDARRGKIAPVPPPSNDEPVCRSASERIEIEAVQRRAIVGSPKTVAVRLASLVASTGADELIISTQIYDHVARVRSYELLSGIAAHEPLITEASSDDA